jgi:hypothetical protein
MSMIIWATAGLLAIALKLWITTELEMTNRRTFDLGVEHVMIEAPASIDF